MREMERTLKPIAHTKT